MAKIKLSQIKTQQLDKGLKEQIKAENIELTTKIAELQHNMYAEGKHSLLIILQGMDASGKDGAVRRTFKTVNPTGIHIQAFKKPNEEEFAHDFLWRVHKHTPRKGMIQVFNRSHYEDILVPSVYGYIPKDEIKKRFELINAFEQQIESNGTKILKFYLHISKDEQYKRLMERIEVREKQWKHNDGDWETRKHWDEFMNVYEEIFEKCNHPKWHIVPATKNWEKVNFIAKRVLKSMQDMDIKWPKIETEKFKKENLS